jgi:hypothetical protein
MDDQIRGKILTLLDQHRIMTLATVRPDGWPQATTVGYANENFGDRRLAQVRGMRYKPQILLPSGSRR